VVSEQPRADSVADPDVPQQDSEDTFDRLVDEGEQRLGRSWPGLISTGVLGAFDIGVGVLALLLVEQATHSVLLGGLAFSIGFIALTLARSELFTENFLVPVTAVVAKNASLLSLIRLWAVTAMTNLAGGWVFVGIIMVAFPTLRATAVEVAVFYIELGITWHAFALAMIGGVLITLMTHLQHATESDGVRLVPAIVMGFLLGAGKINHAIVASLLCFAALQAGAPFGYADWLGMAAFAASATWSAGWGWSRCCACCKSRTRCSPNATTASGRRDQRRGAPGSGAVTSVGAGPSLLVKARTRWAEPEEDTMARVPAVPTRAAGPLGRLAYRLARRRYGAVPEPVTVMLHHRPVFWAYGLWELGNQKAMRRLPASLRELVVYRVATQVGCSWCVDFGTMLQRHHGLDIDRLRELDSYPTAEAFTHTERRALAYADAMTALPTTVTDDMVAELDAELGHDGLVELTYAIAVENHRARFNHALGITAQGFTSGDACRVPQPGT